jgi:hypothetical protein
MWRTAGVLAIVGLAFAGCGCGTAGKPVAGTSQASIPTTRPSPTTMLPPPTTLPRCPDSGVQVTLGVVDAAMGQRSMDITLTNCGPTTYWVAGYPELTLLDEDRQPFAVEVLHGSEPITTNGGYCTPTGRFDDGPQVVTLAPGQQAAAGIVWRNLTTGEFDLLVNAPYLTIAPTPGEAPQELAMAGVMDLGTTGRVGVSAWRGAAQAGRC